MTKYNNEIKNKVTVEICEKGMSTSETALRYGICLKTVEKWVTQYNKDKTVFSRECEPIEKQLERLQAENRRLKRDNEILKKTISLVAKNKR